MNTKQSTFSGEFVLPIPGIGKLSGIRFRNSREILFVGDFSPSVLPARCKFVCQSKFAPYADNCIEYSYQMPVNVFVYLLLSSFSNLVIEGSFNDSYFGKNLSNFKELAFVFAQEIDKPFKK